MKDILIVIDMQNDFIDGALGTPEAVSIVKNVQNKIEEYDTIGKFIDTVGGAEYNTIYFTRDTHRADDTNKSNDGFNNIMIFPKVPRYSESLEGRHLPVPHCIINTDGWQIRQSLLDKVHNNDKCIIDKFGFGLVNWEYAKDFFFGQTLTVMEQCLNRKPEIEICGLCTDICVISNALILKSLYRENEIYVDPKCCAGTTPENHEAALKVMRSCQINIIE